MFVITSSLNQAINPEWNTKDNLWHPLAIGLVTAIDSNQSDIGQFLWPSMAGHSFYYLTFDQWDSFLYEISICGNYYQCQENYSLYSQSLCTLELSNSCTPNVPFESPMSCPDSQPSVQEQQAELTVIHHTFDGYGVGHRSPIRKRHGSIDHIFHCHECHYGTSIKNNFKRHLHVHTRNPHLYRCSVCAKGFGPKYNLKRHFKKCHGNIPPF
ncbi:hypothetical protein CLU79DRAFT_81282 [Phycomyces nitens]|nr:hypothetical protein CLU79DRAFT_81282 [Phycomyces nitens]